MRKTKERSLLNGGAAHKHGDAVEVHMWVANRLHQLADCRSEFGDMTLTSDPRKITICSKQTIFGSSHCVHRQC